MPDTPFPFKDVADLLVDLTARSLTLQAVLLPAKSDQEKYDAEFLKQKKRVADLPTVAAFLNHADARQLALCPINS
jgi:hypothetical protein